MSRPDMPEQYADLPEELWFSEDIAVKKLRPNVISYKIEDRVFTVWEDSENYRAPTWEQVQDQLGLDMAAAEAWRVANI